MASTSDLLISPTLTAFPKYVEHLRNLSTGSLPPLPKVTTALADVALTHTSFVVRVGSAFEDPGPVLDNERYEFHGDRVLGLAVSLLLEEKHPNLVVGAMTTLLGLLVGNVSTLAVLSLAYGLPARLLTHPSQTYLLRDNPNVKADAFEAYVWAITKDPAYGLLATLDWLKTLFGPLLEVAYDDLKDASERKAQAKKTESVLQGTFVPYVSKLEEWRVKTKGTVDYVNLNGTGPAHKVTFEGEVVVNGTSCGKLSGEATKKDAKHALAKLALDKLGVSY